jgi:hypothetical protein
MKSRLVKCLLNREMECDGVEIVTLLQWEEGEIKESKKAIKV